VKETFFFHGTPAKQGFKCFGDAGVVETAGLELCHGDRLSDLFVVSTEKGKTLKRAYLESISAQGQRRRLKAYLEGLTVVLQDEATLDTALVYLGQRRACLTVWNSISNMLTSTPASNLLCVNVLKLLTDHAKRPDPTGRLAKKAIQDLLLGNIFLPPNSPFGCILQAEPTSREDDVRGILVSVLLNMWVTCDRQLHRRIFLFLRMWVKKHPGEVSPVLAAKPDLLIQLLGSTLNQGDDLLACYSWRQLPLHLLLSEIRELEGTAQLRCVKKDGGSYETFDDYMDTYVSLLRENAFANMRASLHDLRKGKLDSRDMRVFKSVKIVSMSPPAANTRGEGTVLGLRMGVVGTGRLRLPMFGSLLALTQRGNFEDAVWATVAGASDVKGTLEIYAELCGGPNFHENQADSHVVARLLGNSSEIAVAESPTFYRAYEPALITLQDRQEGDMPFFDEIVLGKTGLDQPCIKGMCVDGTLVFKAEDSSYNAKLARIDVLKFVRALDYFAAASNNTESPLPAEPQWFGGVPVKSTTLDASQCEALKSALTRRVTMVQGPPGCGKTFVGVRVAQLLSSLRRSTPDRAAPAASSSSSSSSSSSCDWCSSTAATLLRCARCEVARYCSKDCQTEAWKAKHNRECVAVDASTRADFCDDDFSDESSDDDSSDNTDASQDLDYEAGHGPILVVTYKNVALDDFLSDCMKIWPAGVARVGGRPQEGSPLGQRHISVLLREANRFLPPLKPHTSVLIICMNSDCDCL
jgi:hypothetical protein